jgi:CubicO group peptidase (beta-lactamase class C family)
MRALTRHRCWLLISLVASLTGAVVPAEAQETTEYFVGPPLPPLYHPARLERMLIEAEKLSPLTSLLVARRGELVVERYYRGMRPELTVNVKSVSKTLLSPLVGIAIRDGLLEGVDQPLAELLPDYYDRLAGSGRLDPRKEELTLHHLLSMSTGLETTSFRNYGSWVASRDWAWDQLRRPLVCDPGECHAYSTGSTHLLSVILSRRSAKSLRAYAQTTFFGPLGIRLSEWDRDPQGHYLGGNNMALRPLDLLRFGQVFVDAGWHDGRELVPTSWIEASWRPNGVSPWNGHRYGYLWWREKWGGQQAYFAWGYGGQFVVVVPGLDLVAVLTSSLAGPRRGHSRRLRRFLDRYVIPTFAVQGMPVAPSRLADRPLEPAGHSLPGRTTR